MSKEEEEEEALEPRCKDIDVCMTPTDAVSRPKTAKTPTKKRLSGGQDEAEVAWTTWGDIRKTTLLGMRVIPKKHARRRGLEGGECAGTRDPQTSSMRRGKPRPPQWPPPPTIGGVELPGEVTARLGFACVVAKRFALRFAEFVSFFFGAAFFKQHCLVFPLVS